MLKIIFKYIFLADLRFFFLNMFFFVGSKIQIRIIVVPINHVSSTFFTVNTFFFFVNNFFVSKHRQFIYKHSEKEYEFYDNVWSVDRPNCYSQHKMIRFRVIYTHIDRSIDQRRGLFQWCGTNGSINVCIFLSCVNNKIIEYNYLLILFVREGRSCSSDSESNSCNYIVG